MIEFNPSTPFPLLPPDSHSYLEAQLHSEKVDRWLGFQIERVEQGLSERGCRFHVSNSSGEKQQVWIGLASRSLLTPYTEIRAIIERLRPRAGACIADLGAGYGRMGFVLDRHFRNAHFVGYEYVGERVKEARRVFEYMRLSKSQMVHADLSAAGFTPKEADIYFIYDFGTAKAIEKVLYDLKRISRMRPITIVGRGNLTQELIERQHPWLTSMSTPERFGRCTIYRSFDETLKTSQEIGSVVHSY